MTGVLLAVMRRDFLLLLRSGGGFGLPLVFFLSVVAVTPFAIGPDLVLLARIGPAILWIAALLSTLIGLDRLFGADAEDGSLDLLFAAPAPLPLIVLAKIAAHWLATGLPLAVAAPLLGLLLNLPGPTLGAVTLTLLIGTPALTLLGAVGAALTVGLKRGGLLLPVLVMPLTVPAVIFGVAATENAVSANPVFAPMALLLGVTLASLVLAPIAAAAALRGAQG
ncbi:heme exporter protein CcmB [Terrihabitans rhizophilus]|uniref:Heme exporter protein B n=1 Tax=Terrihabitans rhizophilus TaxID=3092662 RepID=A0ABU4RTE0_9HYPH|nr:heme exporter protein CcmB [Terrihabitans sp. PJ23]MDX6806071.1 heme exporter protein CcmB [Terrihabitans sp. PJ23]